MCIWTIFFLDLTHLIKNLMLSSSNGTMYFLHHPCLLETPTWITLHLVHALAFKCYLNFIMLECGRSSLYSHLPSTVFFLIIAYVLNFTYTLAPSTKLINCSKGVPESLGGYHVVSWGMLVYWGT